MLVGFVVRARVALSLLSFLFLGTLILNWMSDGNKIDFSSQLPASSKYLVHIVSPGWQANQMEKQVARLVVAALRSLPELQGISSHSGHGQSLLYLRFSNGDPDQSVLNQIQDRLEKVRQRLPQVLQLRLLVANFWQQAYRYVVLDRTGQHDLQQLRHWQQQELAPSIRAMPGVAKVSTFGGIDRRLLLQLDPLRVQAYRLTHQQIKKTIQQALQRLHTKDLDVLQKQGPNGLANIVLQQKEKEPPVRLGDLAEIKIVPRTRTRLAQLDGQGEVVGGTISLYPDAATAETFDRIKQHLATIVRPPGIEVVTLSSDTKNKWSLTETISKYWQKTFLWMAGIALLAWMHLRLAILMVLVPGTLLLLFQTFFLPLDSLSYGAVLYVVVLSLWAFPMLLDGLHRFREEMGAKSNWRRFQQGTQKIIFPAALPLLLPLLFFAPLLTLQVPMVSTLLLSLSATLLILLFFGPVLAGYSLQRPVWATSRNPFLLIIKALFSPLLLTITRLPSLFLLTLIVGTCVFYISVGVPKSAPIPAPIEDAVLYQIVLPSTASEPEISGLLQRISRLLQKVSEVEQVFGKAHWGGLSLDNPTSMPMLEVLVRLRQPSSEPTRNAATIFADLDQRLQLPGIRWIKGEPKQFQKRLERFGVPTRAGIWIYGPDPKLRERIGFRIKTVLMQRFGQEIRSWVAPTALKTSQRIETHYAQKATLGLQQHQARLTSSTTRLGVTYTGEPIEMQAYLDVIQRQEERAPTQSKTNQPEQVQIEPSYAFAEIRTEDGKQGTWVYLDSQVPQTSFPLAQIRRWIESELTLPEGYGLDWHGEEVAYKAWRDQIGPLCLLAGVTVLALLLFYLRRVGSVIILVGSLPIALVGGYCLPFWLQHAFFSISWVGMAVLTLLALATGSHMWASLDAYYHQQQIAYGLPKGKVLRQLVGNAVLQQCRPILISLVSSLAILAFVGSYPAPGEEILVAMLLPLLGGIVTMVLWVLMVLPAFFLLSKS